MAFGQIDPARLEGDALTRWYLRSPAEIEEERRRAAEQAYSAFLGRRGEAQAGSETQDPRGDAVPAEGPQPEWRQVRPNRWRSESTSPDQEPRSTSVEPDGGYQLAAAASPGFWDYWSPQGCASCHGYTPGTLPPIGGQSPLPPTYSPRSGGGGGSGGSSSRGEWSDRPQCNQQFEADRRICQAAKNPKCWENSNKRLGVCNDTGAVGTPKLGFGPRGR